MTSKKLLLADGSVTIQRVIELTFAGEDVHVLTASDGDEALARIAAEKPDVVLADIGMPKRSGYDVSAFIKGTAELSHIRVLLLAGAFEPVDDAKAREVQCDGVLVKPFEPQQVIARVRELMSGAKGSPKQPAVSNVPRSGAVLAPPGADDFLPPVGPDTSAPSALGLADSLDDYFDKLDEALATITTSAQLDAPVASRASHRDGPVLESELDSFDDIADPFAGVDATQRENAAVPTLDDLLAGVPPGPQAARVSFDLAGASPDASRPAVVARPAVAPPDMTATLTTGTALSGAPASSGRSIIADAFSALVAEQQFEPRPVHPGSNESTPIISDLMIDDIARRVVEKLALGSSEQMQTLVREIVFGVSEKLVREEIDRIRRDAPRS